MVLLRASETTVENCLNKNSNAFHLVLYGHTKHDNCCQRTIGGTIILIPPGQLSGKGLPGINSLHA